MAQRKIFLINVIRSKYCISAEDGQKVFLKIENLLTKGDRISISFQQVEGLSSAFLNTAIGQLYGKYPWDNIEKTIIHIDLSEDDKMMLDRVIENSKNYFINKKDFIRAKKSVLQKK